MRGNKPKYPFRSDDFLMFENYDGSSERVTALVEHFKAKWGMKDLPRYAITAMAHRLHKSHVKEPFWTEKEENYLRENLGLVADARLCKHLKRTRVSIKLKAKRLHINKTLNLNTARSVAQICGIADSKTVMMWVRKGLIKAKRSPTWIGNNHMWNIDDGSLARMLKVQPWLAYLPEMPDSYYKRLVEREWKRDPWFTREQVAQMIGVGPDYVRRYIKRGWLQATKVPGGRHTQVRWMFRATWVMEFLQNDPRNVYHRKLQILTKQAQRLMAKEKPLLVYGIWLIKCPRCDQIVEVVARPDRRRVWGGNVMKDFVASLNGQEECIHGRHVALGSTHALFVGKPKMWETSGKEPDGATR
jgi:hypothetical protein